MVATRRTTRMDEFFFEELGQKGYLLSVYFLVLVSIRDARKSKRRDVVLLHETLIDEVRLRVRVHESNIHSTRAA